MPANTTPCQPRSPVPESAALGRQNGLLAHCSGSVPVVPPCGSRNLLQFCNLRGSLWFFAILGGVTGTLSSTQLCLSQKSCTLSQVPKIVPASPATSYPCDLCQRRQPQWGRAVRLMLKNLSSISQTDAGCRGESWGHPHPSPDSLLLVGLTVSRW